MTDKTTSSPTRPHPHRPRSDDAAALWLRAPKPADAASIHRLVVECPPLDLNSLYAYLLLTEHFSQTCILAGRGDEVLGFVSGYRPPDRVDVLFVWQVAVHPAARGQGLARRLLGDLLARPALQDVRFIETTVSPDNLASRQVFTAVAETCGAPVTEHSLFPTQLFGGADHQDEPLLRIGPLSRQRAAA
ncbi:MAG TPA: diaminobutyrate acetyltransferase [Burkholderiaceae bacterium]|nr:diaminobutyrate acetyltransferase [Burkholderiaceae bacterium]